VLPTGNTIAMPLSSPWHTTTDSQATAYSMDTLPMVAISHTSTHLTLLPCLVLAKRSIRSSRTRLLSSMCMTSLANAGRAAVANLPPRDTPHSKRAHMSALVLRRFLPAFSVVPSSSTSMTLL
jgi:hypothetical protein